MREIRREKECRTQKCKYFGAICSKGECDWPLMHHCELKGIFKTKQLIFIDQFIVKVTNGVP